MRRGGVLLSPYNNKLYKARHSETPVHTCYLGNRRMGWERNRGDQEEVIKLEEGRRGMREGKLDEEGRGKVSTNMGGMR